MNRTCFVAEKTAGSRGPLALLRWALVIVFLWIGCMKFTGYEAKGVAPLIMHSLFMSWLITAFGVQGASYAIGCIELAIALALIAGAVIPLASAVGAAVTSVASL